MSSSLPPDILFNEELDRFVAQSLDTEPRRKWWSVMAKAPYNEVTRPVLAAILTNKGFHRLAIDNRSVDRFHHFLINQTTRQAA